jgi:hypothetical protein
MGTGLMPEAGPLAEREGALMVNGLMEWKLKS